MLVNVALVVTLKESPICPQIGLLQCHHQWGSLFVGKLGLCTPSSIFFSMASDFRYYSQSVVAICRFFKIVKRAQLNSSEWLEMRNTILNNDFETIALVMNFNEDLPIIDAPCYIHCSVQRHKTERLDRLPFSLGQSLVAPLQGSLSLALQVTGQQLP